jgi:hypothetical protein
MVGPSNMAEYLCSFTADALYVYAALLQSLQISGHIEFDLHCVFYWIIKQL